MPSRTEQPRYRFGPLEKRGLIAGWRGGQVGIVTVGMVLAVGLLRTQRPPLDLLAALVVILLAVAAATCPIGGRTCDQWCPVVATWALRLVLGQQRHLSSVPSLGRTVPAWPGTGLRRPRRTAAQESHRGPPALPASLTGCRLLAPPTAAGGLCLGVVHDARARTYTGVIAVSGAAFALLEVDERHRRVAAWSALLSSLAREGSPVHRLQWVERDLPGEPSELARHMSSSMVVPPDAPAARSYAEVVERAGRVARSHQVLLALSIRADRATREIRAFGGGDEGACALLARELRSLQSALFGAEVLVQGALSPRTLASTFRQAIEEWPRCRPAEEAPGIGDQTWVQAGSGSGSGAGSGGGSGAGSGGGSGAGSGGGSGAGSGGGSGAGSGGGSGAGSGGGSGAGSGGGSEPGGAAERRATAMAPRPDWPWPIASQTTWTTHRTEATWHATYWVAEWPRVDVGPDFLAPVLLHSGVRHTMAVTMEPISPLKAARDVQRARTADLADAEIRRRGGFLTSARRGREAQAVTQREVELADGHAEYRFSGYVTVTALSAEALDSDCVRIEQAAGQARLELRRLYGQQDQAFTWTLPLCRGLS